MIDYDDLLYGPVYDAMGVDAVVTKQDLSQVAIRALDRTEGFEVGDNEIDVQTVRPVAMLRRRDMQAAELTLGDLDDAHITLNGETWLIIAIRSRPAPSGEDEGELMLILCEDNA